ncbi:MAG: urea ABC transporter substrate-binding protein [Nitrosopumilus sp.]
MGKIFLPLASAVIIFVFALVFSSILQNSLITYEDVVENYETVSFSLDETNPIKIGILHSLSGTMSSSESPVVDATILAINQINDRGGILDRKVDYVIADGKSDWQTFANEAERLIVEEEVDVIFGGWTSASRKTMKPVFEEYNHLLFYPVQYEGLEQSKNIIYTGAAPNQQAIPAVDWAFENIGTNFYLVGSDYVFPRSVNEIIKFRISELGGTVVGEKYRILGDTNFKEIVSDIQNKKPDVIINTINGDSNIAFFKELRDVGILPQNLPTISLSIGENEIQQLGSENMKGDYAVWNYFQSIDTNRNRDFVEAFQKQFGTSRTTSDPMEAAYNGIFLYAKSVEIAGTTDLSVVREVLKGITFSGPGGTIGIDPQNQHLLKIVRVGQILPDGQFKIISSSEDPIPPIPYPKYKSQEDWKLFLWNLYTGWDSSWSNPILQDG